MVRKKKHDVLEATLQYLKNQCGLAEKSDLNDLLKGRKRCFLRNPRLRLASHFDPEIDLLVFDNEFGTLGLLRILAPEDNGPAQQENIRRSVDQATYIRHLLASTCQEHQFPWTVELVLLAGDARQGDAIGETLREVARETGYLHAIGINVLAPASEEDHPGALRRAFSWLLPETRAWYASVPAFSDFAAPTEIGLHNYRLPGIRRIKLNPEAMLHLVHGHNGSGKSSLAEALELVLTGKSSRLPAGTDYAAVIANRSANGKGGGKVKITIRRKGTEDSEHEFYVASDGVASPLADRLDVASFRLDQPLMDRLSRMGPGERAMVFLKAFFPDEQQSLAAFESAKKEAETSYEALPAEIKESLGGAAKTDDFTGRTQAMANRFGWLDTETPPFLASLADCLPLPLDDLQALSTVHPDFAVIGKWGTALPTSTELRADLERLDRGLEAMAADHTLTDTLARAKTVLQEQSGWLASGRGAGNDYLGILNSWLEHIALVDLAEKRRLFETTLQKAKAGGWQLDPMAALDDSLFSSVMAAQHFKHLEKDLASLRAKETELYQDLKRFEVPEISSPAAGDAAPFRKLSPADIEALNRVGAWICPDQKTSPLGETLNTARSQDIPQRIGEFDIGKQPDWGAPFLKRLEQIMKVHGQLMAQRRESLPTACSCIGRLDGFRKALSAHRNYAKHSGSLQANLLWQMMHGEGGETYGKLLGALNELMALFTPARWAYQDIALPFKSSPDGKHRLDFTWGKEKKDAEFLLNTAELNIFTTALFLLFAPRQKNPLRLLVLDDPLQNMDELTVSCVAKGLAKLNRLWRQNKTFAWQLLFLFHGEEDLERFRREIPAALYHLPWLSPGEKGDREIMDENHKELLQGRLQNPAKLFAARN